MDFRPEHYLQAAKERMDQARSLYRDGPPFALAMYAAGVSVESMLRAFLTQRNPQFEGRHDLTRLFKLSGLGTVDPDSARAKGLSEEDLSAYRRELNAAVNTVHVLWHNNYRYASESRLRAHLLRQDLHLGIKGDFVKENARRLVDAAGRIISTGSILWDLQTR